MSSSLRLGLSSRGGRLISSTLVRLVRRDVGRGVARRRSCGNVGKQAGEGGFSLDVRARPRLCPFNENISSIYGSRRVLIITGFPFPCPR